MLEYFKKFRGFTILEYFLSHPTEKIYLKEFAKKLKVSPRSIKIYCDLFEKDQIITREIKGNLHLFSLNNDLFVVKEMKKTYLSLLLQKENIQNIAQQPTSIALYGTSATGAYDEKSDIDILILSQEQDVNRESTVRIMKKINKEIQLTIIPPMQWEQMKQKRDPFVESILRKHILIKGVEL